MKLQCSLTKGKHAIHEAAQLPHNLYSSWRQVSWQKRCACSVFFWNAIASWQKGCWLLLGFKPLLDKRGWTRWRPNKSKGKKWNKLKIKRTELLKGFPKQYYGNWLLIQSMYVYMYMYQSIYNVSILQYYILFNIVYIYIYMGLCCGSFWTCCLGFYMCNMCNNNDK